VRASSPESPSAAGQGAARRQSATLFVLLSSAAFATSSPLARYARPTHPLLIAFGRLALSALILVALDARALDASLHRLSPAQRWTVFCAGAVLAAHFALFQLGLEHTSLPAAVSLVSLEPLSVVLLAWVWLGIRPTRAEQIGVLVATCGAVVVAQGKGQGEHRLTGDLLVLASVALYGLYLTIARALKSALPARSYAALVYLSAAAVLGPLLAIPGVAEQAFPPPLHGAVAIAAIAVIPTVLGHTAVQTASRTLPPAIVALVSPGETLGAIAIGVALLGATPTATEIVGGLIILVGTGLALLAPRPSVKPPSPSS
jgi:drug/metabolite transporter (DMT)-like permease